MKFGVKMGVFAVFVLDITALGKATPNPRCPPMKSVGFDVEQRNGRGLAGAFILFFFMSAFRKGARLYLPPWGHD